MLHVAIVGAGPAGFYTAEALAKRLGTVAIDIIDRLPTPYGLIRAGVAPDHQSIKAVDRRYAAVLAGGVRFVGNVEIGDGGVSIDELTRLYDAVVLATGAPRDRPLGITGEDLPGVMGSAAFVGWYNGHPDFADLDVPLGQAGACVIGNGNVAIDVARLLAKTPGELAASDIARHARSALAASAVRDIHIIGRRGPYQASFTPKEMGELGLLERAQPRVNRADLPDSAGDAALDPGLRKVVGHLRNFAAQPRTDKPVTIDFDFLTRPVAIERHGEALRLIVEATRLDGDVAVGTGVMRSIDCGLVVGCIGYRTAEIPGVPFDTARGRFVNDNGHIAPGLYVTGWARRGPSGTIGTNRPDGGEVAEEIATEISAGRRAGGGGLDALLAARGIRPVTFAGWQAIDAAEIAAATHPAPRDKHVTRAALLAAADGGCAGGTTPL
ncbi:FAD-dependent oxidoreductase [Glacieibacterium megasporae]|uniref:FAD-dependent oxidoreductase n=1 Tax=Glacieibacterium megasporae TaxID=2835787 RepID=UPI001C1DE37D|nr:FAD-dependent oxidoreductase [Polymorphobacter megasporae]UAJ09984.1 FAD-dependent oxidoreductase [Polymorphobacter megasporae]